MCYAFLPSEFCPRRESLLSCPGRLQEFESEFHDCRSALESLHLRSNGSVGWLRNWLSLPSTLPHTLTTQFARLHRRRETGAATNIIYGLALGYKSAIAPVAIITVIVYISFEVLDMYGVALCALGMLSNLATCLAIDVYGPICDNAGGIAEMSGSPENVAACRRHDAAGNTTAAIGKGFAIGSACLVGLALFGAFVTRAG